MASYGSYSKPMLASRFPRYRKHLLDTPKFMPAPTSLVVLRMAGFSPGPHSSHCIVPSSLSLAVLYSPLLALSCYLTISTILPHSPGTSSLRLSLSSLDIFSLLPIMKPLTTQWGGFLIVTWRACLLPPSLQTITAHLPYATTDLNLWIKQRANQMERNSNNKTNTNR